MVRIWLALMVALMITTSTGRGQAVLPSEKLGKIKAATVLLRARFKSFEIGGSGFVVKAIDGSAIILTNNHVVDNQIFPGDHEGRIPIEAVFHSGTKEEWSRAAEVLLNDPNRDLAV